MLDLGALDRAVRADRGVGADVAVRQPGAGADDRGAADGAALQPRARLDHDAARRSASRRARPRRARRACRGPGGWPRACPRGARCPSTSRARCAARRARRWSTRCWIASVISSSPRGLGPDRAGGVVDRRREHVHARPARGRSSARAASRPARRRARRSSSATPKCCGSGDRREQDQRVGRARAERRRRARRSRPAAGCRRGTSRTASRRGTARPSAPRAPARPARPGRCRSAARRTASRRRPPRGSRRRSPAR